MLLTIPATNVYVVPGCSVTLILLPEIVACRR